MGFLFRFLSLIALVLAVITATVDAIQSVSASAVMMTSAGSAWEAISPGTLALAQATVEHYIHPYLWDPVLRWVLFQPAFVVFLVLSLLLWLIGYRKPQLARRLRV